MRKKDPLRNDHPPAPEPPVRHRRLGENATRHRLKGRTVQVDDILWFMCFLMTYWFFDIPSTLWFHRSVDWHYLSSSFVLFGLFLVLGLYTFWKSTPTSGRVWQQFPVLFSFSFLVLIASITLFSLSVWNVWNVWTLYIVFVTSMTANSVAAISL